MRLQSLLKRFCFNDGENGDEKMDSIGFLIDAITVIVFALFVLTNYKKGLLSSVFETIGIIASMVLSSLIAPPVANFIYNNAVAPSLIHNIEHALKSVSGSSSTAEEVSAIFDQLPQFVENGLSALGISKENILYHASQTGLDLPHAVESMAKPVFLNFITVVCSAILFVVIMLILLAVIKFLTKSLNLVGLGFLNRIGGAVVGIVKSVFLFMILAFVIYICVSVMPTEAAETVYGQIESTTIFKYFFDINIPNAIISGIAGISGVSLF